jgi:hypothetical protein
MPTTILAETAALLLQLLPEGRNPPCCSTVPARMLHAALAPQHRHIPCMLPSKHTGKYMQPLQCSTK